MQRRMVFATFLAVLTAVVLVVVPLSAWAALQIWRSGYIGASSIAAQYGRAIDRRLIQEEYVSSSTLRQWMGTEVDRSHLNATLPDGKQVSAGTKMGSNAFEVELITSTGVKVNLQLSATPALTQLILLAAVVITAIIVAMMVSWGIAQHWSRRICAPLIYLAAQAEQLGTGNVRPRVKPSGIEEIDLVQQELVRTSEALAGRLAAERQFASDASHQLRTPLTALSMRLEEIQMIAENPEVSTEAEACLEQVERLTQVVEDLLKSSRRKGGGTTQAINIASLFAQQKMEWMPAYKEKQRDLEFLDETDRPALATPGNMGQVLATLIENSLNYGDGTTWVKARMSSGKKGIFFEVSDQGEGIDEEIAPDIFKKGVSGHGSTGIGLALAKTLVEADGGRIELANKKPAIFSVYVNAVPASLNPEKVLPEGALISVARPKRRFSI